MEKIIYITLGGQRIPIEENAYTQLRHYMDWLRAFFGKEPGGDEIYQDMESRIAELFLDRLKNDNGALTVQDVDAMMAIMGTPQQLAHETSDDFEEVNYTANKSTENSDSNPINENNVQPKYISNQRKLNRIREGKWIGGVCNGIGDFFKIDPLIVRIIFVLLVTLIGTGFWIYVILWVILPMQQFPENQLKSRFYRDSDNRMLGGVCGGIAAVLKIPVKYVRLIFIAPIIINILLGVLNWNDELKVMSVGAFPSFTVLYLMLWILMPRAKTLTQKLELSGQKINVANVHSAMTSEYQQPTNAQKVSKSPIITIAKVAIYGFILFSIMILALVLLGVLLIGGAVITGTAVRGVDFWTLSSYIFTDSISFYTFWFLLGLFILIPILLLVLIFIRIFSNKKQRYSFWILGLLWIASIMGLSSYVYKISNYFNYQYNTVEVVPIQMSKNIDTLTIDFQVGDNFKYGIKNDKLLLPSANLNIVESADSNYALSVERFSRGGNQQEAKELAVAIPFAYSNEGNTLKFNPYVRIASDGKYRLQEMIMNLSVPKGQWIRVVNAPSYNFSRSSIHLGDNVIESHVTFNWKNGLYRVEGGSAQLIKEEL